MDVQQEHPVALGLTTAEAETRRRRGEANTGVEGTTRSYAGILRTNVFSFFNTILFVIGAALLVLGRYSDALISVGLGLINAVISAVQEIRAKRKLDRLQLLDRAAVVVVRDGREVEVAPDTVVRGDVLRVRPGDQIVVDGPLLEGRTEADESLLTGESDPVVKEPGDELRSGSLCVAGAGHQLARDVGPASYAGRLTAEARRVTTDPTPLQRRIDVRRPAGDRPDRADEQRDPRAGRAGGVQPPAGRADHGRAVRAGALRAVLPHRPRLHRRRRPDRRVRRARAAGQRRRVGQQRRRRVHRQDRDIDHRAAHAQGGRAAPAGRGGPGGDPRDVRPQRHHSEPHHRSPGSRPGVVVTTGGAVDRPRRGAVHVVAALVRAGHGRRHVGAGCAGGARPAPHHAAARERRERTHRARAARARARPGRGPVRRAARCGGRPALPALEPVAIVALADELRPDVAETISRFRADGVALKVLSGDDPRTVAALATQAGLDVGEPVPGAALDGLDDPALDRLVARRACSAASPPSTRNGSCARCAARGTTSR